MTTNIATDNPFNAQERDLLRALCGLIIPASDEFGVPGADDDLIFADISRSAVTQADDIRLGLDLAATLESLGDATARLQGRPEMGAIVTLVMQCYYRDDRVMQALGMEPRPPFPNGFEVAQGDWSMLEPVQRRGKIWRDT